MLTTAALLTLLNNPTAMDGYIEQLELQIRANLFAVGMEQGDTIAIQTTEIRDGKDWLSYYYPTKIRTLRIGSTVRVSIVPGGTPLHPTRLSSIGRETTITTRTW